ncbi:MAG: nucleoside recognition domain-containing protein, partial [Limisphaerales bacterium]
RERGGLFHSLASMLNYIWLGLIVFAVVIGGVNGHLKDVADKCFEMAEYAVMRTALPLVGVMALWLGIMRLAQRAGLVSLLARLLRPLMIWLFPEVPADHPAMGSMLLNIAAGILGLGNASTPLGLRAMEDLEKLNPHPGTATNAMCTFLAINTSSIQLIPATAIAILAANQSANPTAIVGTSIMATTCAAIAGVSAAKILERLPVFRLKPLVPLAATANKATEAHAANRDEPSAASTVGEQPALAPLQWWGLLAIIAYGVFFLYLFAHLAFPALLGPTSGASGATPFIRIVNAISTLAIPFVLSAFPLYAALRRVKVYEEFVEGAKEGFEVAVRIIPYLVAILVAIGMFRAAGGIEMLGAALKPIMAAVGFPPDLLPLVIMRPLSGSGTLGIFSELVKHAGPDSLVTRMGATIYGSTETTFYVLAVYFGAVAVKRTRYAVLAGLTADFVGVVASIIICKAVFG